MQHKWRFKLFKSQTCHFGNPKQRTEFACSESGRSFPSDIQDARMNWRRQCFRISAFPKFQKRNGFFNIYLRKFQVCQSSSLWNRLSRYDMVCILSNSRSQIQHTVDTNRRLQSSAIWDQIQMQTVHRRRSFWSLCLISAESLHLFPYQPIWRSKTVTWRHWRAAPTATTTTTTPHQREQHEQHEKNDHQRRRRQQQQQPRRRRWRQRWQELAEAETQSLARFGKFLGWTRGTRAHLFVCVFARHINVWYDMHLRASQNNLEQTHCPAEIHTHTHTHVRLFDLFAVPWAPTFGLPVQSSCHAVATWHDIWMLTNVKPFFNVHVHHWDSSEYTRIIPWSYLILDHL